MAFPARFDGVCKACRKPYAKGDPIDVLRARGPRGGKQWAHASCAANEKAPEPKPAPLRVSVTPSIAPAGEFPPHKVLGHARELMDLPECAWQYRHTDVETMSRDDAARILDKGDPHAVDAIEKARERVGRVAMPMVEHITERWDVLGHRASVARYLGGAVCAMRRRVRMPDDAAPVRVYVNSFVSWRKSLAEIHERAGMVCAIVDAIATRRPIELWGCVAIRQTDLVASWRIEDPTDLVAVAGAIGAAPGRGPLFQAYNPGRSMDCNHGQDRVREQKGNVATPETARAALGLGPDDIYVPAMVAEIFTEAGLLSLAERAFGLETVTD